MKESKLQRERERVRESVRERERESVRERQTQRESVRENKLLREQSVALKSLENLCNVILYFVIMIQYNNSILII